MTEPIDLDSLIQNRLLVDKTKKNLLEFCETAINEWFSCVDRSQQKIVIGKYSHFSRKGPSKLKKNIHKKKMYQIKPYIYEILDKYSDEYSNEEKKSLFIFIRKKIRGIYKHAQALKTGLCNRMILNSISEKDTISFCVSKNTIESNTQWIERLLDALKKKYPGTNTSELVMIVSSKKNTLNNRATHCTNILEAQRLILKSNSKYKIIFNCSNKARIYDILYLTELSGRMKENEGYKKFRIIHDEAHNKNEGIPAYRDIIENILLQDNVITYTPCTATNENLEMEGNFIWDMKSLEKLAINYTKDGYTTKSYDTNYSSCSDAIKIKFEDIESDPKWIEYDINEIPKNRFLQCYEHIIDREVDSKAKIKKILEPNMSNIELPLNFDDYTESEKWDWLRSCAHDIRVDYKRKLDYCKLIAQYKEKIAINRGLNIICNKNLNIIPGELEDRFSLRLISTPCRIVITDYLAWRAVDEGYNVLAIYGHENGDKHHLFYKNMNNEMFQASVDTIMDSGEFNTKLAKLIDEMKSKTGGLSDCNWNKPLYIITNYMNSGESLSFVNYKYGTLDINTRLVSTNATDDYQEACRSNYMDTKFKEFDPSFVHPKKWLIGEREYFENIMMIESENDARIDELKNRPDITGDDDIDDIVFTETEDVLSTTGTVAVPIKIDIGDLDDHNISKILDILSNSHSRTKDEKVLIMQLLKSAKEADIIDVIDTCDKFNFEDYTLIDVRCYNKTRKTPEDWRFKSYQDNHKLKQPYMNDKNKRTANECEILIPSDMYILKNDDGTLKCKNKKSVWWIGYKY